MKKTISTIVEKKEVSKVVASPKIKKETAKVVNSEILKAKELLKAHKMQIQKEKEEKAIARDKMKLEKIEASKKEASDILEAAQKVNFIVRKDYIQQHMFIVIDTIKNIDDSALNYATSVNGLKSGKYTFLNKRFFTNNKLIQIKDYKDINVKILWKKIELNSDKILEFIDSDNLSIAL